MVDIKRYKPVSSIGSSSTTGTQTSIAGSSASVTLLAANSNRVGATIFNDQSIGGATLYIRLNASAASTSSYTTQIGPLGYYELPFNYTGAVTGIWSSTAGNARITELT